MATTKRKNSTAARSTSETKVVRAHRPINTRQRAAALAVGAAFMQWMWVQPSWAAQPAEPTANLPTGGKWASNPDGTAGGTIKTPSATEMQMYQNQRAGVVDFNCFCSRQGTLVNLTAPTTDSTTLIRSIEGANLWGRFTANDKVFITSSAGVYFSPSASVNVNSLVATSLSITNADFFAGRYNFSKDGSAGSVVNDGHINIVSVGGYAVLAGPQVQNNGVIVARAGTVSLAAGDRVTLDMVGDGLIKVSVDAAALNALALNSGSIEADGGHVVLTARSANALLDTVINNTGVIRAKSLVERGGEIVLDGGGAGIVANSGTLDVSGTDAGAKGGNVAVLGQYVALNNGTRIDASGDAGGGDVNVGGSFQGQGPLSNASQTIVASDASIKADAITSGNGGNVVVWSDNATQFYGTISARGGAQSGNGGNVEVSGKQWLNYQGSADTRAPNGQTGTLLLDPDDLTIVHDTNASSDSNNSTGPAFVASPAGTNPWTLTDFTINGQLGGASVTITTSTGAILISNTSGTVNIDPGGSNANTVTMTSATGISWNGGWTYGNNGQLTLHATNGAISGGANAITIGAASPVLLQATTGITAVTGGTSIAATSSGGNVALTVSANNVGINTLSAVNGISAGAGDVSLTHTGTGTLTLNQAVSGTNVTVVTNDLAFAGSGAITAATRATVAPRTASTAISLGDNATDDVVFGANNFSVNTNITATTLQIGNSSNTGGITVKNSFDPSFGGTVLNLTTGGAIVNGTGTNTIGGTNVLSLALVSATGVGSASALDTNVTSLAASAGTSGAIQVDSTNAALNITTVDGVVGLSTANGSITINTTGDLTVSQAVSTGGTKTLSLNFGSGGGSTFTLAATGSLTATGSTATVTGGGSADVFDLTAAPSTTATVAGGGGSDELKRTNKTWTLTGSNTGNNTALTWSSVENLTDTGTGTFNINAGGSIAGNLDGGTGGQISYASQAVAKTLNLATPTSLVTEVGGSVSGIGSVVGGSTGGDTVTGASATYNLTGSGTGHDGTFSWSSFENIVDSGTGTIVANNQNTTLTGGNKGSSTGLVTTFTGITNLTDTGNGTFNFNTGGSIAGNLNGGTNGQISYASQAVAKTLNLDAPTFPEVGGALSGITNVVGGSTGADTVTGAGHTYNLTGSNAGNGGGFTWSGFENLTDTSTGTFNINTGGSIAGNLNGGTNGQVSYAGHTGPVTLNLNTSALTGVGGTVTKINNVTGSANTGDSVTGTGKTWNLSGANSGDSSGFTWSAFENLTDGGTGTFNVNTGGSISGALNGGTGGQLSYAGHTGPVTLNLNGAAFTGIGGAVTGISNVTGSASGADSVTGTSKTYTLSGLDAGSGSGYTWSGFENIADAGTGTISAANQVTTLTGSKSGTTNNLSGTFAGIGNLTDTGTGTFNVNTGGSISGALNGGTGGQLSYAGHTGPVVLNLNGAAFTGIGGAVTGISNVTGSASGADSVTGTTKTYNLTGGDAGNGAGFTWTSFENLTDSGAGTFNMGTAGSVSGSIAATGGALNYGSYGTAVTLNLAGTGTTGIGGTWGGITTVTGPATGADTVTGAGKTYTLTGSNAGNGTGPSATTVSWTSFENLTDTGTGTFNINAGGSIAGNLDGGTGGQISYASQAVAKTLNLATPTALVTEVGGTVSGIGSVVGGSTGGDTVTGASATYNLTGSGTGNNGTFSWSSFENIVDSGTGTISANNQTTTLTAGNKGSSTGFVSSFTGIGNLTDTGNGTFNFNTGGSISGNLNGGTNGQISYASQAVAKTLNLDTPTFPEVGGAISGITNVVGGSTGGDTVTGAGHAYNLTGSNAGNGGGFTWSGFENLTDTTTGTFNINTGGSIAGNLNGGASGQVSYAGHSGPVALNLNTSALTGVGGTVSGINNVTGSASTGDSVTGTGKTWNLTGGNSGDSSGFTWSAFENLTDGGTGTFNIATAGSISGNLNGGTNGQLSYATHTGPVTLSLNGGAFTGVGGTMTGISNVTGSASGADSVTGTSKTYTLTGLDAGNNGSTFTWSGFENIADAGTGTISAAGQLTTLTGGTNKGTSANHLTGTFSGIGNLTDTGTGTFNVSSTGSITGNLNGGASGQLSYATHAGPVTLNLAGGAFTGIGGSVTNISNVTGSANTADQVIGASKTYTLTGLDAGSGGTYTWSGFENIADSGTGTIIANNQTTTLTAGNKGTTNNLSGTFSGIGNLTDTGTGTFSVNTAGSISGNLNGGTGGQISYATHTGPVTLSLNAAAFTGFGGTVTGISNVTGSASGADSVTGTSKTYTLTGLDAGNGPAFTWSGFENIADAGTGTIIASNQVTTLTGAKSGTTSYLSGTFSGIGNLTDTGTGTFNINNSGSISGNLNGGINGQISYAARTGPVTLNLAGTGFTGVGGTVTNITNVAGSLSGADTVTGASKTWNLTGGDAGNGGGFTWSSFENLVDTGTGTFNVNTGGSISGSLNGGANGRLSYAGHGGPVTLNLAGGAFTGIGGSVTNISNVTGSANTADQVIGASKTYTLTGLDAGSGGTYTWSGFENIADSGTGTIVASNQATTLTGAKSGSTSYLSGTFSGIGNLTDTGAGTFNVNTGGSISGNLNGGANGRLSYAGHGGPVTLNLAGGAFTGIGGSVTNISNVTGSANTADQVIGASKTYTLTGLDAGSGGTYTWSGFENIADSGTGTIIANNQTTTLTAGNKGTTNNLSGTFSGIGNLTDTGTGTFNVNTGGSISGNLNGGTGGQISYAGHLGPVVLNLNAVAFTGFGGTVTGITNVTGSASGADQVTGTSKTYTLTGLDAGNGSGFAWSGFENIADGGTGTINASSQVTALTGSNSGTTNRLSGTFSGIGNLTDTGTGTFNINNGGSISGNLNGGSNGQISYAARTGPVTLNLAGGAFTGIGGTVTGISNVAGSLSGADTVTGTSKTYNLFGTDAGSSGTLSWSSFENLVDTGTGTFNMNAGGRLTGNLSGGTNGLLSYAGRASQVALSLDAGAGGFQDIGGTVTGITTLTGSANTNDVLFGNNRTWNLTGPNAGNTAGYTWTAFENVVDQGTTATFNGGAGSSLSGVLGSGTTTAITLNGTFTTGGEQRYTGAVTLGSTTTIVSAGGPVSFGSVTGTTFNFSVTSGSGITAGAIDTGTGTITLIAGGALNVTSVKTTAITPAPGNPVGTFSAGSNVLNLFMDIQDQGKTGSPRQVLLTGHASSWTLTGPVGLPPDFAPTQAFVGITFNGAILAGIGLAAQAITGSIIGGVVADAARQAVLESQQTDSVQQQVAYGFAGDVGTTPPMDHRIDETGISVPKCFNDSREGQSCQ